MDPELKARAEAVYQEFINLCPDALGGVRVPKELGEKITALCLDVIIARKATGSDLRSTVEVLKILTRPAA